MYTLAGREKSLTVLNDCFMFPFILIHNMCVCLQRFASFSENFRFLCTPITSPLHECTITTCQRPADVVCHRIPSSILQDTMKDLKLQKEQSNEYAQSSILRLHLFVISSLELFGNGLCHFHWNTLSLFVTFAAYHIQSKIILWIRYIKIILWVC